MRPRSVPAVILGEAERPRHCETALGRVRAAQLIPRRSTNGIVVEETMSSARLQKIGGDARGAQH
jgi:hypothetical protein